MGSLRRSGRPYSGRSHVSKAREEARRRLYETACTHRFAGGLLQQRREVYRVADDTYFVEIKGGPGTHRLRYRLAERVWSTDDR